MLTTFIILLGIAVQQIYGKEILAYIWYLKRLIYILLIDLHHYNNNIIIIICLRSNLYTVLSINLSI